MQHFEQFETKTGIIVYLNFKDNNDKVNKYYLCFSNVTKFNINSFIQGNKHDIMRVNNITCLIKIPLAFIITKDKEICSDIIKELSHSKILTYPNDIPGRNILKPTFANIKNIYKIINTYELNIIKSNFIITLENNLNYNKILIIKDLINNCSIKYENDYYKNDSEEEDYKDDEISKTPSKTPSKKRKIINDDEDNEISKTPSKKRKIINDDEPDVITID